MRDIVEAIRDRLAKHQGSAFITCHEDCWCHDIGSLLTVIDESRGEDCKPFSEPAESAGAEHVEVKLPLLETDADRRLKEWEAKAVKCPSRNYYGQNCSCNDSAGCRHEDCPFAHWGWR